MKRVENSCTSRRFRFPRKNSSHAQSKFSTETISSNVTPPQRLLPLLQDMKNIYLIWNTYYLVLPKPQRYSIGQRIDALMIEAIEMIATAGFLAKQEKLPYVRVAIRKIDTIKVLLMILWETKSIDHKQYGNISLRIDETGKRLGGWQGQLVKQNSPKR
jgi:hypothetical protein